MHVAAATHRGLRRQRNEDYHGLNDSVVSLGDGEVTEVSRSLGAPVIAVIADGLGGHPCGDVASLVAVDAFLADGPTTSASMAGAVHAANRAVVAAMPQPGGARGMGTTIAAIVITSDEVVVVNVGDSPVFTFNGRRLVKISTDDVPDGEEQSGFVTQTVGGGYVQLPLDPHVTTVSVDGHVRVLLCTDGLSNFVSEASITAALRQERPRIAADALIAMALAAGAPDNVTVIIADVSSGLTDSV